MKRFVLILLVLLGFAETAFSESRPAEFESSHTIMFASSTLKNGLYDKSDEWVTEKIKMNLISSLQQFSGFVCLDLDEAVEIVKVQKQFASSIYDDSQAIEIGKLIKAKEVLSIRTTRFPSGSYSINVTILNVETGEILGMFSSPKTYENAESYVLQAHYDCLPDILRKIGVQLSSEEKSRLQEEIRIASEQAERNKVFAKENAAQEEIRSEKARAEAERRAKIEAEEREKREAKEKAEYEAAQKALAEKKAKEAAAAAIAKKQNPFANTTYACEFENGSRYDSYKIKFTSQNECTVTVSSINSQGVEKSVTKSGSYSFANDILSINVRMQNDQVRHVQKIQWKGQISFKNGYSNFNMLIPVSSSDDAKKIRAEFNLR